MELGLQTALHEITLVFFTTLAPSGALAFALMALPLVVGWVSKDIWAKFNKFLCVPLLVSMVGLVASATHLGNPSNALYIFLGVGQSPLSNEVFFAIVFLALGGLYWLYSFALKPNVTLSRIWLSVASIAAIGFIVAVSYAYDARTVITWLLPTGPLSVVANALLGGPLIALACFAWIGQAGIAQKYQHILLILAVGLVVVNAGIYAVQWFGLEGLENSRVSATSLVPHYWLYWGAFVVLEAVAVTLAVMAQRVQSKKATTDTTAESEDFCAEVTMAIAQAKMRQFWARCAVKLTLAAIVSLSGIFIMRFVFYMMHMTVGLGV